jgi:hypothetical protein
LNQVNDRFGLGEVDPPVEESSLSKLPGLGQTGSALQNRIEDFLENQNPAVGLDFHHVFAGVGSGLFHEDRQDLIDHPAAGGVLGAKDFSEVKPVGNEGTLCSPVAEDPPEDLPGLRAAEANNADAPDPQGGGDRGNRVPWVHEDFFSGLMMTLR